MMLPANHPARFILNDEVHARPPEFLIPPCSISFLALVADDAGKREALRRLRELAERFGATPPEDGTNHFSADFGPFRLKWERHSEYIRYKFIVDGDGSLSDPAIGKVPRDWLETLPGQTLVATNILFVQGQNEPEDADTISERYFDGNTLIGAIVAGGNGRAYTDFRIREDGFGRLLVQNLSMTPRQAGRTVQRLAEIDTYRMLALLALPVAQALTPALGEAERELVQVTSAMVTAGAAGEPGLLERLMKLEAGIESRNSESHYRFSAAAAYYDLVQRRIGELRETRIEGLQQFQEFMERRLAPAMTTCIATASRLQALASRVASVTQLLSTKVDIALEQQNQAVLASMDKRAKLQLRLQQTVEGLSVAAVTYYIVGLIGYGAKALKAAEVPFLNPELAMGLSIPAVAGLVAYSVHRVRDSVSEEH